VELLGLSVEVGDEARPGDADMPPEPDRGDLVFGYEGVGHISPDLHQLRRLLDREQKRLARFLTVATTCDI
jgi:hypothetical protein